MRSQGYLAFVVGICLTAWACNGVIGGQRTRLQASFERDADKIASDTNVRLQTYFDMLLSLKGMFAVNPDIDRAEFARFVRELNLTGRYPGFQAIQFVRYVPAAGLPRLSEAVRRDRSLVDGGYPGFALHPLPLPNRDDHYIIDYNEPMKGNENAFGLDLSSFPPHLATILQSRDSGDIMATERITLVQDANGQPGFVARAPVYRQNAPLDTVEQRRAAFVGMVAIVFRVNNLMHEVIDPALAGQMNIRIHDAGPGGADAARREPANLMYDNSGARLPPLPGMRTEARVRVAQRQWVMAFAALGGSRYSQDVTGIIFIGAGGVVISALIAALMTASRRSRNLAAQLRVTLDEQRAFQDSANVGIALFSKGVIARCNRGLEEMMGYAPGTLSGESTRILAQPAGGKPRDPFAVQPAMRRCQSEAELVRKDGSTIWCLLNGKALGAADLSQGGVWVIQNISDRKQTEAALVHAKTGLEHSLAELAQQKAAVESAHSDLSAVLATLKQAQNNLITSEKMAALGALVAGIAHELNTPIGNSLLTATALSDMVGDFEKKYADGAVRRSVLEAYMADTRMACDIMAGSLRRAANLITSFKQVAVDQTSDQRRSFDLCEVVRDTLATYAAQLRRVNCTTQLNGPPVLTIDSYPGSVGQVLSNLINNALLHAFEGRASGMIEISLREVDERDVLLVFRDDGRGMTPRTLHQVFDPFFTTKMGQGGSGLGMNIVYNIVTGMLGGRIDIDSSPGTGASISIRMPRTAPERLPEEAPGAGLSGAPGKLT